MKSIECNTLPFGTPCSIIILFTNNIIFDLGVLRRTPSNKFTVFIYTLDLFYGIRSVLSINNTN